ncbi:broad-complex core protein isoforms 1/2/3/4/5-like [Nylanderia fulva]|uniref:broad-complex core protein isoforms 1/2/3/4/5-like n=1 Tax=Nylanderia fulva TaxID=613905 RepID=UPI0010FBB971|nr:broad-complex core protein isoforms 1/2/3/4/5-like [Nylanderia fulva]
MKEDSVLSFKWQSFPSHMVVSLDTCYEKQQFVDLSLVCKDNTILKCHKMVLANSSSFFRRLIMANEHPHPMIVLHDVEADDLKTLVNFMYCGEIQVVQSEVRRLLKLAETLEVTGLRHIPLTVLPGEGANNTAKEPCDVSKKTATVSRLKVEEARSLSSKNTTPEHETNAKAQSKVPAVQPKLIPLKINPHKPPIKIPLETTKKKEEININELCQRLENSNSGISIVDINDMPSTSKGLPNIPTLQKRKEPSDPVISWPRVLSTISTDKLPLKKIRCIMDEIEITTGNSSAPVLDNKQNEPLDRRKVKKNSNEDHNINTIYIKDEIDISSDVEDDVDMDPLEVDDNDNENSESSKTPTQQFYQQMVLRTSNRNRSHTEFSARKGPNS